MTNGKSWKYQLQAGQPRPQAHHPTKHEAFTSKTGRGVRKNERLAVIPRADGPKNQGRHCQKTPTNHRITREFASGKNHRIQQDFRIIRQDKGRLLEI